MMDLKTNTVVDIQLVQVSCQKRVFKVVIDSNLKPKVYNACYINRLFFCVKGIVHFEINF